MSEATEQKTNEIQIPANELTTLLGAVQLASTRGAYRPEEFKGIGTAYESVFSFLSALGVIKGPGT
jgi:hypothetical protein